MTITLFVMVILFFTRNDVNYLIAFQFIKVPWFVELPIFFATRKIPSNVTTYIKTRESIFFYIYFGFIIIFKPNTIQCFIYIVFVTVINTNKIMHALHPAFMLVITQAYPMPRQLACIIFHYSTLHILHTRLFVLSFSHQTLLQIENFLKIKGSLHESLFYLFHLY